MAESSRIGKDRIKDFLQGIATAALKAQEEIERNNYEEAIDWLSTIHEDLKLSEEWIVNRLP